MPTNTTELVSVRKVSDGHFESVANPQAMGNAKQIAYGGCAIANAIHSAFQSLPDPKYNIYSVLGYYLGPSLTDRKLLSYVYPIRETRTFVTFRIEMKQKLDNGSERSVMALLIDFQAPEPAMLTYSAPPIGKYKPPSQVPTVHETRDMIVKREKLHPGLIQVAHKVFGLMDRHFEQRTCHEGVGGQNLYGMAKHLKTSQDELPITAKTSADWFKAREPESLAKPAENFALLGFIMDAAISFIPLTHNHQFLDDSAACSSLDFALRFFKGGSNLRMQDWHLREVKTIVAAEGRTYSDSQIWDEQGNMVASMSQQSIMRVKPSNAKI